MAETNFKIVHNILPCNKNLLRLGEKNSSLCDICQSEETIPHLLFDCVYSRKVWNVVTNALDIDSLNIHKLLLGDFDTKQMHLISVVVYFIYKDWLINSLENTLRQDRSLYVKFCAI